jgi:hypothetical protein
MGRSISPSCMTYFGNNSVTQMTHGLRKPSGGGTSAPDLHADNPFTHSLHHSQVFPTATNNGDDLCNLRDTEGLSMREMMEMEHAARMSQAAAGAAND